MYNVIKTMGRKKTKDGTFLRKKRKKVKQMSMSIDGKETVFLVKLKLEGGSFD